MSDKLAKVEWRRGGEGSLEKRLSAGSEAVAFKRFSQLLALARPQQSEDDPEATRELEHDALLASFEALEPRDEIEAQIALQMIGTHTLTMRLAAAAMDRPHLVGSVATLSRSYVSLVESLRRHRGKATLQKVVVEHVTVEAGGQAVVGAVTTKGQD